jgi:hypothetical protein
MSRKLSEHSDEELLAELLSRSTMHRGPFRVTWTKTPINVIVGIGEDHHADIYIEDDAYDVLRTNVADLRRHAVPNGLERTEEVPEATEQVRAEEREQADGN